MRTGSRRGDDPFFTKKTCDRCGCPLHTRTMSWFTEEAICMDCSNKEKAIREALRAKGQDDRQYEGCGYVPDPATI